MLEKAFDSELLDKLVCPVSLMPLIIDGEGLITKDRIQRYPIVRGIPCLIHPDAAATHRGYSEILKENKIIAQILPTEDELEAQISDMLVATCGHLFRGVRLNEYFPIPPFPTKPQDTVLDVGCNWGRWTISATRATSQRAIGVDIHLKSLLAAKWLAEKLCIRPQPLFVLADARYLPFKDAMFWFHILV